MDPMPEPITDFYIVEFPSPAHAEAIAAKISDAYLTMVRQDGALRPVIWAGSPLAESGVLFLSVGAVHAAQAAGINVTPIRHIPAEELPIHRTLLLGTPQDRV
jgi:hypothetical protein